MAKRYKTSGRTLGNYRGRTGSLMLVPTRKAEGPSKPFVVAETYGIACGVLTADADPSVRSIESEPSIPLDAVPSGQIHLDLRLGKHDGTRHFVEVRDVCFLTSEGEHRLQLAAGAISRWGDSFEFRFRDDTVRAAEVNGLQFLFRYRNAPAPSPSELDKACEAVLSRESARLTEWLEEFRGRRLTARVLYWCIANQALTVVHGDRLFPNGRLTRNAGLRNNSLEGQASALMPAAKSV